MRLPLAAALLLGLAPCAPGERQTADVPYQPDRRDYRAFAAGWPEVLEPNYLPFMVHRTPSGDGAGDLLFFCRWPDEAMPLPVYLEQRPIPESVQDEFDPRDPGEYTKAVRHAFAVWERELEGLVRFRWVAREEEARLSVRLLPERAGVDADRQVLGTAALADACQVLGRDPDVERLLVEFRVPELRLYLADEVGLLPPDQVEWVALHEIGHALGMRGHSPIPADLMFEVARDRMQVHEGLSIEDQNSFVSLYRLPNGAVFGRVAAPSPPSPPDPGAPALSIAPYVDARLGFELHLPAGWMRVETARGMVAVDGTTWDYTASFQIVIHRFATIDDYLDRYGAYYARRGRVEPPRRVVVNGRPALQAEIERYDAPRVEQITLVEVGDGRVMAIVADCPSGSIEAYRPWFQLSLGSLEITELPEEGWPPRRR